METSNNSANNFIEKNSFFILLIGIMLGGVLIGSLAYCGMSEAYVNKLTFSAQGFVEGRAEKTIFNIFFDSLLSSSLQLFITFILGFWSISQPFELAVPFFKGLGLGASLAQIYAIYGFKGVIIIVLLIIPYELVIVFALVIGVREAIKQSNILARNSFFSSKSHTLNITTKLYFQKFAVLEILMIAAAIIDSLCALAFSWILK